MSKLDIHQIPTRNDNYVYLLRDTASDQVGVIDPSDAAPVIAALEERGWRLTHIFNTHHHNDHTGGNLELKEKYGCTIFGARCDHERIAGIDMQVDEGDTVVLGDAEGQVFFTPGHTRIGSRNRRERGRQTAASPVRQKV